MPAPILLATLNAKYLHSSLGLRYLAANMGDLHPCIAEYDINQSPLHIAEKILSHNPALLGLGVYVWNARPSLDLVGLLKTLRPTLPIILGGPEVSHETEQQEICQLADLLITGEADLAFADICRQWMQTGRLPSEKIIAAPPPALGMLQLPYALYSEDDLAHRMLYVEASRGCPYRCSFCLSSLDVPVRTFDLSRFFAEMERLLSRGARQFKFVDRTFNLQLDRALAVLDFFRERFTPGLFLHFEVVPGLLPPALLQSLARFPAGSLQLEVGIQTFDEPTAERIQRRQDAAQAESNLRLLREQTHAHLHADLIVGLPGESLESFAAGFDRLLACRPHEIQVGLLKRLRGAPITALTDKWEMVYNPEPPYELLRNNLIDFPTMRRLSRFAKYWDLLWNSGNYLESVAQLWSDGSSPFNAFLAFTDWAYARLNRTDSIRRDRWAELLLQYTNQSEPMQAALREDFQRTGRREESNTPHSRRQQRHG